MTAFGATSCFAALGFWGDVLRLPNPIAASSWSGIPRLFWTFMARPQRFCIFCGGAGLTREHVWADWLKKYVPKDMPEHTALFAIVHPTHSEPSRRKRSGDLQSRRLRVVCKSCNTGWMCRLQERAKPYLLPLIQGEVTAFDLDAQTILSAWVAMFVMVAEHFNPYTVTTSQEQRSPICWILAKPQRRIGKFG